MNNVVKSEILKYLDGCDFINGVLGLGNCKLVIESLKIRKYGYMGNEKIGLIMNVLKSNCEDFENWVEKNKHLSIINSRCSVLYIKYGQNFNKSSLDKFDKNFNSSICVTLYMYIPIIILYFKT